MNESKDSISKGGLGKKIIIAVFSIVVFGLALVSLGYILPITSNVCAQQIDVCDEDDPPPPPDGCPCGDCVNGCGGGCSDNDNDGNCDDSDNCVGYESIEYEEVCDNVCDLGDVDPYTGECRNPTYECEIVGFHEICYPY